MFNSKYSCLIMWSVIFCMKSLAVPHTLGILRFQWRLLKSLSTVRKILQDCWGARFLQHFLELLWEQFNFHESRFRSNALVVQVVWNEQLFNDKDYISAILKTVLIENVIVTPRAHHVFFQKMKFCSCFIDYFI